MNPVRAFLDAIEPLRTIPVAVLCEYGHVRPRISSSEAAVLGNPKLRRRGIACRTKGCRGHARPLLDLWESP